MASPSVVSPDVLITIKLQIGTENRRFKLPLRDLGANIFPGKLRALLALPPSKRVVFERYSDSAGTFITLDSANASVYKQLYRAAKAKLKLRIKATVTDVEPPKMLAPHDVVSTNIRLPPIGYMPPVTRSNGGKRGLQAAVENVMAVSDDVPQQPAEEIQNAYAHYVRNCMADQVKNLGMASPLTFPPPQVKAPKSDEKAVEDEAPLPKPSSEEQMKTSSTLLTRQPLIRLRAVDQDFPVSSCAFTVCCNGCELTIPDTHWHCSICHNGDYDLCQDCVNRGIHCGVEDHYLIKRLIEGGKVITSTTETVPKKTVAPVVEVPSSSVLEPEPETEPETEPVQTRTCNCCVSVFDESKFITCKDCEDYDLCIPCHLSLKHGHNPTHEFVPVDENTFLESRATLLLKPGRHANHHAICDGCNKYLYGVRNKCLRCPDWDYCNDCVKNAKTTHPGHGFVAVHEPLSIPRSREHVHHGINCDGPLCLARKTQYWIVGDRYKCTVCHDTDFCARCEALPNHRHNRTHPLIKFRTPVRSVTVTTLGEKDNGEVMATMGDRVPQTSSKATETKPAAAAVNAATQVQVPTEAKPVMVQEPVKDEEVVKEESKPVPASVPSVKVEPKSEPSSPRTEKPILQAHFLCDATPDGSKIKMGSTFQQVWVLRNPGPHDWPAGCSVRYVGGDNMLNVDNKHPSSVGDIASATESNVINHPVAKDEEVAFWVTMKAPERVGKAISYWRLRSPDAIPFGHRLWCDIEVYATEPKGESVATPELLEDVKAKEEAPAPVKEEKASESQMIFPKLDKESPVSSTYHEAVASPSVATPAAASNSEEQALLDDVESLAIEDVDSTDDGFLTDDDYEILDMEGQAEAVNGKK